MKKKKEKKEKKEWKYDIPNSPFIQKLLLFDLGFLSFFVLLFLLEIAFPSLSVFLWYYFVNPFSAFLFLLGQVLAITIFGETFDLFFLFFGVMILLFVVELILTFLVPKPKEWKFLWINRIRIFYYSVAFSIFVSLFVSVLFTLNFPSFGHLYLKDQEKDVYTVKDLEEMSDTLSDKILTMSDEFERDRDGNIVYDGSLIDLAIENLRGISSDYPFLKGYYPKKLYSFSLREKRRDPSTLGLTFISTVKVDYSYMTTSDTLNTITHELCHTKGITRENEATFCSYIAGVESPVKLSQYAAYVEGFGRLLDAYFEIDRDKAVSLEDKVISKCLSNGYREFCNFYLNDLYTDGYVKESDSILMDTYLLNHYEYSEIENFVKMLESYDLKIWMRGEEVSKDTLETVFLENPNGSFRFEIENDEEVFSSLKKWLQENKYRFLSIIQDYPTIYEGVSMDSEEAIHYYLDPIPSGNFFASFGEAGQEAYDYSRTVRLLLEYYHR